MTPAGFPAAPLPEWIGGLAFIAAAVLYATGTVTNRPDEALLISGPLVGGLARL